MKLGDEGSSCSVATAAVVIRKAAMVVATRRNDILKIHVQKHQEPNIEVWFDRPSELRNSRVCAAPVTKSCRSLSTKSCAKEFNSLVRR